ncbi:MAG: hypothetical protein KI786_04640, partial [Mameliella sp.]|nr:hypothetical protein [Phaeodactylibacter sp.]
SYLMDGAQRKNLKRAGTNHPGGVTIHYFLPEEVVSDSQQIALAFYEESGKHIRTFSTDAKEKADKLEVEAGGNTFNWNLQYPKAKEVKGMILWWAGLSGPKAVPGYYNVKLMTPKDTLEQSWVLKKDPRISSTVGDLQARFDFMQSINKKVSEAHQAITDIRAVREQMQPFMKRWKGDDEYKDLLGQAEAIDSVMTEVETALYQTKNRSRQDPLNFPIKLTNKLAHINALVGSGHFPPTEQDRAVKATLEKQINEQLVRFYALKETDIPAFNAAVKAKAVDVILLKEKE